MPDLPAAWWKPEPDDQIFPEWQAAVEANYAELADTFGDFDAATAAFAWARCAPSPDGRFIGVWIRMADGQDIKIAFDTANALHRVVGEIMLAVEGAIARGPTIGTA